MNILIIYPHLIHSKVHHGSGVKVLKFIKLFSKRHNVFVICFCNEEEKRYLQDTDEIKDYCRLFKIIPRRKRLLLGKVVDLFFRSEPLIWLNMFDLNIASLIRRVVDSENIDIVQFEFMITGGYVRWIDNERCVKVLFADAPLFRMYQNSMESMKPFSPKKLEMKVQYNKLKKFELEICKQFDKVLAVTPEEREFILSYNPNLDVCVSPLSVDTSFFSLQSIEEDSLTILFIGNFITLGNSDAVLWFIQDIFPIVQRQIPKVRLFIVGANPPRYIQLIASSNVIITGYVPEIRDYISRCSIFISPIRQGGGFRMKNLEAMAMGKPLVTTSLGAEGIGGISGKHLIIENKPEKFAHQIIKLLSDKEMRKRIGENGRLLVKTKFDDRIVLKKLEQMYESWLIKN